MRAAIVAGMTAFMRPGARRPVAMFAFAVLLAAGFSHTLGLGFLQGDAIARPMPLEDLKRLCDSRRAEIATERRGRATPVMPAHRPAHRQAHDCAAACATPPVHGAPARVA